jgi:hypothetical protein
MVISILPAITADSNENFIRVTPNNIGAIPVFNPDEGDYRATKQKYIPDEGGSFGGAFSDPIIFDNGGPVGFARSSQWDLSQPFDSQVADDFELDDDYIVTDVHWWGAFWNIQGGTYPNPCDFNIYIYENAGGVPTGGPNDPSGTAIYSWTGSALGTGSSALYEYEVDLVPPFNAQKDTIYWIAIQAIFDFVPDGQWGWVDAGTGGGNAVQGFPLLGTPYWTPMDDFPEMAFYLTGIAGGDDDDDDDDYEPCIEDVCDFEIVEINQAFMYDGMINELPQIINITYTNRGEVGINEVKILVDIYKKICGDTSEKYCDEKFDLRFWEDQIDPYFDIVDDYPPEDDTWVLQGGPDNRWLTNNQAFRCTKGEDRSFGGDEDKYLGLADGADPYDTDDLIFNPDDPVCNSSIAGAACATLTFSHWAEGEYTFDDDGNVIPVDYGTISYCLNGTGIWTDIPIRDFVAYDTNGEWSDVTIKFINVTYYQEVLFPPGAPEDTWMDKAAYKDICPDCDPGDDDIVILEEFPNNARIQFKWSWHKDPCYQFEGWYVDNICITRTEKYYLELVHQVHDILEIPGCDPEEGVQYYYHEFELGWDPDPDTWYQIDICGQVFSPNNCENDTSNNCIHTQFFVTDIHDIECKSMELIGPEVVTPGTPISVEMTIKNIGTFAEDDVPVELKVADCIVDTPFNDDFETDPSGRWDFGTWVGYASNHYWRWTKGDPSFDLIGDGRSSLPGVESLTCSQEQPGYPRVPEGVGSLVTDGNTYDLSDAKSAILSGYFKWSIDIQGTDWWGIALSIGSGPAAGGWHIWGDPSQPISNDWQYLEWDILNDDGFGIAPGKPYYDTDNDQIPTVELGISVITEIDDGITVPPGQTVPWSGVMMDQFKFEIVTCGGETIVVSSNASTGTLAPGQEDTLILTWSDPDFCNHCLIGDVNLATDVDTSNDECDLCVLVVDSDEVGEYTSLDLTGEGDCLWHLCDNRGGGDDTYAWAGIEEETWAHYVNDMDDSLISPPIDLSGATAGVSVNFTTWYEFFNTNDFGEVYARANSSDPWTRLGGKIQEDTDGYFVDVGAAEGFWIPLEKCSETTQIRFRMVSDHEDVSEGWYVDDIALTDTLIPESKGIIFVQTLETTDWSFGNVDADLGYGIYDNFQITEDLPITEIKFTGLAIYHDGTTWQTCDEELNEFDFSWYDDPYSEQLEPDELIAGPIHIGLSDYTVESTGQFFSGFEAFEYHAILPSPIYVNDMDGLWFIQETAGTTQGFLLGNSYDGDLWSYHMGSSTPIYTFDQCFTLYGEAGGGEFIYGDVLWSETWDDKRDTIAPWQCQRTRAGDFWKHYDDNETGYTPDGAGEAEDYWVCHGYPGTGKGLNNVLYTELDLTSAPAFDDLAYVELMFRTAWLMEDDCTANIEISADWDGASPMGDATWAAFWKEEGPSQTSDWVTSHDLVDDDRFVLNQYIGMKIYIRFRYTTPGEGFTTAADHGWAIDDLAVTFKSVIFEDNEPPVTSICFDTVTGEVTLLAVDYPIPKGCGVKATYYKIDGGATETYTGTFTLGEGTHTVEFWSEDLCGNTEAHKTRSYTLDTTPPTCELTSPEEGKLYLFGSPIMDRIIGSGTLCIGRVPVAAAATDDGSGVAVVMFAFDNGDSGFDNDGSDGFTYDYRGMHFGALTITATAIDGGGLMSSQDSMTITVYSLGLM